MKRKILLITLLSVIILGGCTKETKKEENKIVENTGMLSYTIDGEKTDIKPSKEEGYIVNKILCDKGSDLMWDNDNWEVELTKINSKDRCKVDFTKDTTKEGYRVTVTSNVTGALDSLSKATTLNGTVKIYSTSKIENVSGCNGVIEDNKVIVSNVNSNQACNITIEDKTLAGTLKTAYPPQPGRTDFSKVDNAIPALYIGEDNQGTTYYFSGDGTNMNNWVSFAGKLWRIIRINGNGSVRLLYAGSGGEDGYIESGIYYATSDKKSNHPAYVGWKYTYNENSTSVDTDRKNNTKSYAYQIVENWYNGLESTNQNYIDTNAIYCNDRNLASENSYSSISSFNYVAYERLVSAKTPTFSCSSTNDRFTTFGLMTADEISFAGGLWDANSPKAYFFLNKDGGSATGSKWWWTISPHSFSWSNSISSGNACMFVVIGSGKLSYYSTNDGHAIRPVISLKKEVLVTGGDGSGSNPYTVTLPN